MILILFVFIAAAVVLGILEHLAMLKEEERIEKVLGDHGITRYNHDLLMVRRDTDVVWLPLSDEDRERLEQTNADLVRIIDQERKRHYDLYTN
jgi:hypothetical protein